jgi:hypothetical protein
MNETLHFCLIIDTIGQFKADDTRGTGITIHINVKSTKRHYIESA